MSGSYMRSRTKDERVTGSPPRWESYHAPGVLYSSGSCGSPGYTGEKHAITEFVWQNAHKRLRSGEILMSDMTRTIFKRDAGEVYFFIGPVPNWYSDGNYVLRGDFSQIIQNLSSFPSFDSDADSMKQLALQRAFAKIDPAAVLGHEISHDWSKTVGMLKRPFRGARDLLSRMTKYRNLRLGKTAASAAKATADSWLEYRYGWRPLISDVSTIAAEVSMISAIPRRGRLVARASCTQKIDSSCNIDANLPTPNWVRAIGTAHRSRNMRAHAGLIYDVESRIVAEKALQIMGYRPGDFAKSLWETVPYSFVADWFVDVQGWIGSFVHSPGVKILASWCTYVNEVETTINSGTLKATFPSTGSPVFYGTYPSSTQYDCTVIRDPRPTITSTTPVLKNKPLSGNQQLDAVSLIVQKCYSTLRNFKH